MTQIDALKLKPAEVFQETRKGIGYALIAYTFWGIFPLYWRLLRDVPPLQILGHRVFWSAMFFSILLWQQKKSQFYRSLKSGKSYLKLIAASASIITVNWFTYIYGVNSGRVLQTSLGYFIVPMINVALGVLFLKEKLNRLQKAAIFLAAIGVLQLCLRGDEVPFIALTLAITFGIYGLLRKQIKLDPLLVSTLESSFMIVPTSLILGVSHFNTELSLNLGLKHWSFLILGGVVTALPLLWFAQAMKRLPLSTMGFFQYIGPSIQFLIAVFLFSEPLNSGYVWAFSLIWPALGIFSYDLWRTSQQKRSVLKI